MKTQAVILQITHLLARQYTRKAQAPGSQFLPEM